MGKIVEILTSQLIFVQPKHLPIRQFDDFGRNWPYTKSRQNSEKREMVNCDNNRRIERAAITIVALEELR